MYPLKKMSSPLAHELAEAILLLHDVRHSFSAMKIWFEKYADEELKSAEDQILSNCLYRDAIVQFAGCFDGSAELHLDAQAVFAGIEGGPEFVQWMKDIRDSYAAHKFGALRQCVVGVVVDPKIGLGVGHLTQMGFAFGKAMEADVLNLFSIVGKHLEKKVREMEDQLLDEAKAMSIDDLLALENARTYGLNSNEFRLTRSRLQAVRSGKSIKTRHSSRKQGSS